MGDPNYKRTSGYRNFMNKRGYLPIIRNGVAQLIDRFYEVRDNGWRRMSTKGKDK